MSKTQNHDHSQKSVLRDEDPSASARKTHHLELAQRAQTPLQDSYSQMDILKFFNYEPLLNGFPDFNDSHLLEAPFAGKTLGAPLWISSMTGGTGEARHINQNLAHAAKEFGLGIGLGSCRQLLTSDEFFEDFNLRPIVGHDICLMANFGLAQVDQLLLQGHWDKLEEVCKRLEVDGLFIHINPLQEFFQAEGDQWKRSPLEIIDEVLERLEKSDLKLGIKEVGQGMGPESLAEVLKRPIDIFEFGALGGTNFSFLEKMRSVGLSKNEDSSSVDLRFVGHDAQEMVRLINQILEKKQDKQSSCPDFIISGGIRSYLQGHYLMEALQAPCVYGMALPFLTHAAKGRDALCEYISSELNGLKTAKQFLRPKGLKG